MITQFSLLIVLVVNAHSAELYHKNDQILQSRTFGSNLGRRDADSVASDLSPDHPVMLLLPRVVNPKTKLSDKSERQSPPRTPSRSQGRNPHQLSSGGVSSSAQPKQAPPLPKEPRATTPPKSKAGGKERPSQDPASTQQHTNNPSKQQHARQSRPIIETAQANIARDHDTDAPNRPSSPLNPAVESLAKDTSKRVSLVRFSQVNTKAIESEHAGWFDSAKLNIARAQRNDKARSAAGAPKAPRPGRTYNELKAARSAVKDARTEAKTRVETAASALHNRPATSPTTRVKFAQAELAVEKAQGVTGAYYNREYQASLAATAESRWHDYPGHVKKAYRSSARHTALEAYHYGRLSEYQSKLDSEALSKLKADDPRRGNVVKVAVESRKDFHAAAKIYYLRDNQYREVRKQFDENQSSEDEREEFADVPRKKN